MNKIVLITFAFLSLSSAVAREIHYLGRSPKALLMGDAFTALADDEYTLFYNPAGLAKNKGVEINMINPKFGVTNAIDDIDKFSDTDTSDPVEVANSFMEFPVYLEAGVAPTMKFGPFGLTGFLSQTTSIVLHNPIHPVLELDYRYDKGAMLGFGMGHGSAKRSGKGFFGRGLGQMLSYGAAVKYVRRESIKAEFDVFGTELLSEISKGSVSDIADVKELLGYGIGTGIGLDVGIDYSLYMPFSTLSFAASIQDVGNTSFRQIEGDGKVTTQKMLINTGVAFKQDFHIIDYTLSFDLHPINRPIDYGSMAHVGFDIGIPFFRFMAGYNAGYTSYGATVRLWPIELTVGLYGIEIGSKFKEQEGKRAVIYLSLFDFSFDA